MASKICDICGNATGLIKMTYPDGIVCNKCFSRANSQVTRMYRSAVEVRKVLEHDFSSMTLDEKNSFSKSLDEQVKEKRMDDIQAKIKANNVPVKPRDTTPRCAKCGSTSISANQKGFGVGKAAVGTAVAGPLGLIAGNLGAKKVRITCLKCGHQWMAGNE